MPFFNFDEPEDNGIADRSSVQNFHKRADLLAREYQIAIETQIFVGQQLSECARQEGVNQFVNCRDLAIKYLALVDDKYHGMIFPEGAKVGTRNRPFINSEATTANAIARLSK